MIQHVTYLTYLPVLLNWPTYLTYLPDLSTWPTIKPDQYTVTQWPLNPPLATSWPSEFRKVVQCIVFLLQYFSVFQYSDIHSIADERDTKGKWKVFREFFDRGDIFQLSTRLPFPTHPFSIPQFLSKKSNVSYLTLEKVKCSCDKYSCELWQILVLLTNFRVWVNRSTAPTSGHLGLGVRAKKRLKMQRKFSAGVVSISGLPTHLNETQKFCFKMWLKFEREFYHMNSDSICRVSSTAMLCPRHQPPLAKFFWFLWKSKSFSSYSTHLSLFILSDTSREAFEKFRT